MLFFSPHRQKQQQHQQGLVIDGVAYPCNDVVSNTIIYWTAIGHWFPCSLGRCWGYENRGKLIRTPHIEN